MSSEIDSDGEACPPDYDVRVEADELLDDLAEKAASKAREHAYCRRNWQKDGWWQYRQWMKEHRREIKAYATAIAMLHPESHDAAIPLGEFVADDGTVNVREYMREISRLGDDAHDRGNRDAEHGYAKVTSLLRNEYGIGWPRLDELGGNPLEEDLP